MRGINRTKEYVNRYKRIHGTDDIKEVITGSNIALCGIYIDEETDKDLYEKFKGMYTNYDSIKCIFYNSNMCKYEERYVLCHELGHATHHPDINIKFLKENTLFNIGKYEREADIFAAEFLIDDEFIIEHKHCTTETVSKILGVPEHLVKLKLNNFDKSKLTGCDEIIP